MKSLFKISNDLQLIINTLIENGGELTEGMEENLSITEGNLKLKAIDYGIVIRKMDYEIGIVDAEVKRLQEIKRIRNNTVTRLKTALSNAMLQFDINEIETPTTKINFRKSESVEIIDESLIDKKYKKLVLNTTIDKMAIKKDIKAGIDIDGAKLNKKQNLQIK